MLTNYIKIAMRTIMRYKGYSVINVTSLVIGMTCCILIMLWVEDELRFDRFHEKADYIYRLIGEEKLQDRNDYFAQMAAPLGPAVQAGIPEVIHAARYSHLGSVLVTSADKPPMEATVALSDPEFFDIFSFSFVSGDAATALETSNAIVLTRKTAQRYFGNENPLGSVLKLNNRHEMVVTAVIDDIPSNSSLQFDCLSPFNFIERFRGWEPGSILDSWGSYGYTTYLELHPRSSPGQVEAKVKDIVNLNSPENAFLFHLQSLKDIHLHSAYISYQGEGGGDIRYVYIFSIIALFVLVIACINFTSLATARASYRAREVGIRKTVGCGRVQLFRQFMGESFIMSLLACLTAVVLVELFLPQFRILSGKSVSLDLVGDYRISLGLIATVIVTGVLAGVYPALYLSSFHPLATLTGRLKTGGSNHPLRRGLVIIQFAISVFLIVCTVIVSNQLTFLRKTNLGFDKEHMVYMRMRGDMVDHQETIRQDLSTMAGIVHVTFSSNLPTSNVRFSTSSINWNGKSEDEDYLLNFAFVDYDYLDALAMEMAAGRFFSRDMTTDSNAVILNETAAREFGLSQPLETKLTFGEREATIIGIVKDFHYSSLHSPIGPLAMVCDPFQHRYVMAKIRSDNIPATMVQIEGIWKKYAPEFPFECRFLDEDFDALYSREQRMETLFAYFSVLAIGIACLGLMGLTSFMTERRAREIGIRKALGASVGSLVCLLSKEFVILVAVSNLLAWPLAWYSMRHWLDGFAYRTGITMTAFIAAGAAALVITIITVSFLSVKAALANPVEVLRRE